MIKFFKDRFQVNQNITQLRYNEPIRKGTIVKGPFRIDGIDHYHVNWDWCAKGYEPFGKVNDTELIADARTTKYSYE